MPRDDLASLRSCSNGSPLKWASRSRKKHSYTTAWILLSFPIVYDSVTIKYSSLGSILIWVVVMLQLILIVFRTQLTLTKVWVKDWARNIERLWDLPAQLLLMLLLCFLSGLVNDESVIFNLPSGPLFVVLVCLLRRSFQFAFLLNIRLSLGVLVGLTMMRWLGRSLLLTSC